MTRTTYLKTLAAATLFAATGMMGTGFTAPAEAATVTYLDYAGNDCSGVFGQGFENCKDPTGSPVIAKYDTPDRETTGKWSINSLFSGVLSSMFTLVFNDSEGKSGSWTYNQGSCTTCPVVTSYTVKAGNGFRWYYTDPKEAIFSGTWGTPRNKGLSHITFYDTAPPAPIPLPAAGFLLMGALAGLGLMKRHRQPV